MKGTIGKMSTIEQLKREIVEISRSSFENKLFAGTSGNLSIYLKDEGYMLITPTSIRYEIMEPEDVVTVKLDGTILEGKHRPSSEWPMHAAIYESCPHVGAVFHTHSPYATSFAVTRQTIPLVLIEMRPFLGGEVACARFEKPGTRELGMTAVEELNKGKNACLLANHGVIAVGETLAKARIRAEYVEDAATIYHRALQVGKPILLS